MHATDHLLKSIKKEQSPKIEIEPKDRQLLRLAALLHDIGHSPFSHAMENLFSYYPEIWMEVKEDLPEKFKNFMRSRGKDYGAPSKHEDFSDYLICTDPKIQGVLKEWIEETHQDNYIKMDEKTQEAYIKDVIAKLAIGEHVTSNIVTESRKKITGIFTGIMSGDIDADKIDYLARDNYYCGLPYELDVTSLREQLVVDEDELTLLPNGMKFVNTVIMARYWLITEVHQHKWDTFTTAKAVELLHNILTSKHGQERADLIFNIFTQWQDSKLIELLTDTGDTHIRDILTTQHPVEEIGYLDYFESHPYIRMAIQVLSEKENHHHIPLFQNDLRAIIERNNFFAHINRVKSPSFGMNVKGGNLLRNEILRGISEESLKNLRIVIYGMDNPKFESSGKGLLQKVNSIDEQSEQIDEFVNNLGDDALKKLIAYLAIRRYRKICQECADQNEILAADFLLLIMEMINNIISDRKNINQPTRQVIYRVAKLLYGNLNNSEHGFQIRGHISLKENEITPSFHREIRKYEQLGLISYSRIMDHLKSEDITDNTKSEQTIYRFDRRFTLSKYGIEKLEKTRDLRSAIPEYKKYLMVWDLITTCGEENRLEIEKILMENNHIQTSES